MRNGAPHNASRLAVVWRATQHLLVSPRTSSHGYRYGLMAAAIPCPPSTNRYCKTILWARPIRARKKIRSRLGKPTGRCDGCGRTRRRRRMQTRRRCSTRLRRSAAPNGATARRRRRRRTRGGSRRSTFKSTTGRNRSKCGLLTPFVDNGYQRLQVHDGARPDRAPHSHNRSPTAHPALAPSTGARPLAHAVRSAEGRRGGRAAASTARVPAVPHARHLLLSHSGGRGPRLRAALRRLLYRFVRGDLVT